MTLLVPKSELHYKEGELYQESCRLEVLAKEFGTPLFVYSSKAITDRFNEYRKALDGIPHLICYGMKANSNLSIVKLLGDLGAGMDLVSGGELHRVLQVGISTEKMIFSGVGKTSVEIRAAIQQDILMLNVECPEELETISRIAGEENKTAGISIRINPEIDAKTHPYITTGLDKNKFGIHHEQALDLYLRAKSLPGLEIRGIQSHIGSQIIDISVYRQMLEKLLVFRDSLEQKGIKTKYLDLGGGLGISYDGSFAPSPCDLIDSIRDLLLNSGMTIMFEPGRSIVGNAGVLLTKVLYTKENQIRHNNSRKRFVIVDTGMTENMRPCLYDAQHQIAPLRQSEKENQDLEIHGPVCESTDRISREPHHLPPPEPGDFYAIQSTGAYGFCMASQYNSRCLPAEVLVEGDHYRLIRQRETFEDLVDKEVELI